MVTASNDDMDWEGTEDQWDEDEEWGDASCDPGELNAAATFVAPDTDHIFIPNEKGYKCVKSQ